jgi:hypothetical protein
MDYFRNEDYWPENLLQERGLRDDNPCNGREEK